MLEAFTSLVVTEDAEGDCAPTAQAEETKRDERPDTS